MAAECLGASSADDSCFHFWRICCSSLIIFGHCLPVAQASLKPRVMPHFLAPVCLALCLAQLKCPASVEWCPYGCVPLPSGLQADTCMGQVPGAPNSAPLSLMLPLLGLDHGSQPHRAFSKTGPLVHLECALCWPVGVVCMAT